LVLLQRSPIWLTGRKPQENADWIVGLGGNGEVRFSIVLLEVRVEQTGVWLTKEEVEGQPESGVVRRL
jgi:hypothetical protein